MKLSIVTTLYQSSPYIEDFYNRISIEAQKITDDYEIIFVDDGSPDDSLSQILKLYNKDSKIKVIELSRNFGHHKAIMTGLSHVSGEFIFLIDVDLEEKPELLGIFWEELENSTNIDVIYGVQESRKGAWFERWSGTLFYKIFNFFSDISIPTNITTVRLTTKQYNDTLIQYQESELFAHGLFYHCGFKQKPLVFHKASTSPTTYTFKKKLALLIRSITSFSSKPLVYIFNIGFIITFISSLFIMKLFYNKLFYNIAFEGWTSIIVSIWFFGGLIILSLGMIGIYLSQIFIETKHRPFSIIRNIYKD
ncbi:MAG: glycosyltransferase family 2 protein [Sulfurovum sp.]|nr:glycosyltransferase family 2 protein [Sulfurovum sp.]